MKRVYSLRNIILIALISIFCGLIFLGIGYLRDDVLIPFSLVISTRELNFFPTANAVAQGPWVLGAALVGDLFRAPGSALLGQAVSSVVECFIGGVSGIRGMLSGILEGLGTEAGFACSKYRHYTLKSFGLGSFFTTLITFAYDVITKGYFKFSLLSLIIAFVVQFASIFLISYNLTQAIRGYLKRSQIL